MTSRIAGKTIVITGAAGGIGAATARRLAEAGAQLVLVDTNEPGLKDLATELGDVAMSVAVDVADQKGMMAAVVSAVDRFGGIDVVVANAAINHIAPVQDLEAAAFDHVMAVNLGGAMRAVVAGLPHVIQARGYVLLVCSGAGLVQGPFQAPYNASKAGLHAFGNTLRQEMAREGVEVGIAYFNAVDTEAAHRAIGHPLMAPLGIEKMMTPRPVVEAATALTKAIERRSRVVYVPRQARMSAAFPSVLQRITDRWVARRLKRAHDASSSR